MGDGLNAVVATGLMALVLAVRARRERMPTAAARADVAGIGRRLLELGSGTALPFALQAIYLVCVPIAAREGVGSVTSFGYAYLIAAGIVGISASSVGLVTAVPLTRIGLEPTRVARHIESSSWPALILVAATAGIFAVTGAEIAGRILGGAYEDDVGAEISTARGGHGAVHGRLGRALRHLPARLRSGSRHTVAADRARRPRRARAPRLCGTGARWAGGARARARGLHRPRIRVDADAAPRGTVDGAPARGRRRGRRRVRTRRVRAGGGASRAGAGGSRRARALGRGARSASARRPTFGLALPPRAA